MSDQFDVSLEDPDLLGEVEMTTNLIIAASEAAGPLAQAEIDAILGIAPDDRLAGVAAEADGATAGEAGSAE